MTASDDGAIGVAYIRLKKGRVARTREIDGDALLADYDARGNLIGIEILAPVRIPQLVGLVDEGRRGRARDHGLVVPMKNARAARVRNWTSPAAGEEHSGEEHAARASNPTGQSARAVDPLHVRHPGSAPSLPARTRDGACRRRFPVASVGAGTTGLVVPTKDARASS